MHSFTRNLLVRLTALVAAAAFATVPAELLASCGCQECACPAAMGDKAGCCCTGQIKTTHTTTALNCCVEGSASDHSHAATQGNCCGMPVAAAPGGCSCQPTGPSQPTGAQVAREDAPAGDLVAFAPLAWAATPAASLARPAICADPGSASPVPLRVLYCVWRN